MSGQVLVRYISLPINFLYAWIFANETFPIEDNFEWLWIGVCAGLQGKDLPLLTIPVHISFYSSLSFSYFLLYQDQENIAFKVCNILDLHIWTCIPFTSAYKIPCTYGVESIWPSHLLFATRCPHFFTKILSTQNV